MSSPYDANSDRVRCAFRFGQTMKACPACGGFNLQYQTPIKMEEVITEKDTARSILGKYARATKAGATPLEGPAFIHCRDCRHKGPALDCTGRTSEDVGLDPVVASELKRLWNSDENKAETT
jgi:hypothetical protein